jgi:hypothetical protein
LIDVRELFAAGSDVKKRVLDCGQETRLGLRLRRRVAIRQLWISKHPRMDALFPIGNYFGVIADKDGVYNVPASLLRPAGVSTARFVGQRPGAELRWQVDRHIWLQADYGVFYAGKFLKQKQPGRNLNYWALWVGYKF